ncbi:MAG: DM13 domain-containing protein [Alphaproteobacteria bacterium]|nr:DM13 domain-containing protein [Alphaproteobacteria bacterium]
MNRKFLYTGGAIGVVVIAAVAWILVSPLFIDEVVEEAFPGVPTPAALAEMTEERKAEIADDVLTAALGMPDHAMDEGMDDMPAPATPAGPQLLASGQFRDADSIHRGSGDAKLFKLTDADNVLRLENLKVTNGPDLRVYLVRHPDPTDSGDVKDSEYVDLGPLKGNIGNQNYTVPAGTDLSQFASAVVWCRAFGVLFAAAPLATS